MKLARERVGTCQHIYMEFADPGVLFLEMVLYWQSHFGDLSLQNFPQ